MYPVVDITLRTEESMGEPEYTPVRPPSAKTQKQWKRQALTPCKSTHEHHIYVLLIQPFMNSKNGFDGTNPPVDGTSGDPLCPH